MKIGPVDTEIALLIVKKETACQSLANSPLGATMSPLASNSETKPCFIWRTAKNARSISLPSLQPNYLVAMVTALDKLENKVHIHYLQEKRFHMVKILR